MRVLEEQTVVDLANDYELRQQALEALTDDAGVIRGSSDDVEGMMLQLHAQRESEAEYFANESVSE